MAKITLDNVTKNWGETQVLKPMNLAIENGEFVAILGPSGCGKSTTLFLLAGLYAPSAGEIAFDGHNVNRIDARDRNVGIVFQSYALYPNLTVRENIAFPLRFKTMGKEEVVRRVEEAANLVQISALLDRRPSQLSGGQQQRVALARALVKEPNILLLDEPLSNLDATLRITMRAELKSIQRRLGFTTLIVTHDQIEAITMADRIICMNNGEIAQIGTPDDLYRCPNNLFVAGFIGTPPMNLLKGEADGRCLQIANASFDLDAECAGAVTFGLRPEDIALVSPEAAQLQGEVVTVEPMGREVFYTIDTPAGLIHALEYGEAVRHAPGAKVGISCKSDLTLVFDACGNRIADLHADFSNHAEVSARVLEPAN
ncbi:ABC transporter ATP-binding protein [Rhizobium wenxiniae]|uniref:Inositol-phosphate transport system ATP-binding protein n=1 Tax=Rhizobium wenxiniae TaxID=1737357 RepID=A0A7X0D2R0_9HYPH|nr:ABC transporter ATP-binding protein [Rhizobium wenxiniae]MBB6165789.1 inositol-phosphate transport system ATP-binding protein [Rhizobium wenxiniae]GGG19094.1 ABC transporter ATP-binding protein [Rhizobium wenxiniae]